MNDYDDPLKHFADWYDNAKSAGLFEPTAMSLATVSAEGQPSVRMVLLKSYDKSGFVFCSNYESHKGKALAEVPRASLLAWWDKLQRQVRIDGNVRKSSEQESNAVFAARPRGSQIGAWASNQSGVIKGRDELQANVEEYTRKFEGQEVPRPPFWGCYLLEPEVIEFWQGREDRLHDRLVYHRNSDIWTTEWLAP